MHAHAPTSSEWHPSQPLADADEQRGEADEQRPCRRPPARAASDRPPSPCGCNCGAGPRQSTPPCPRQGQVTPNQEKEAVRPRPRAPCPKLAHVMILHGLSHRPSLCTFLHEFASHRKVDDQDYCRSINQWARPAPSVPQELLVSTTL